MLFEKVEWRTNQMLQLFKTSSEKRKVICDRSYKLIRIIDAIWILYYDTIGAYCWHKQAWCKDLIKLSA